MGRFVLRRTESGREKIAQVLGDASLGGVRSCILNYMRFAPKERFCFDFFVYEESGCADLICEGSGAPADGKSPQNGGANGNAGKGGCLQGSGGAETAAGRIPGDFAEEVRAIDPEAKVFSFPRIDRHPLAAMRALRRAFRDGGYAAVHAHMTTLSALVLPAAKAAGVPVRICHAHSSFDRQSDHCFAKAALRPFAAIFATHRMACGKLAAESLYRKKADEAFILPNAVDLSRFACAAPAILPQGFAPAALPQGSASAAPAQGLPPALPQNIRLLLFAGRFVPQKNLFFLLDAFAAALPLRPMALALLGDGPQKEALRAHAKMRGIEKSVLFLPPQDPAPWYAAADALVLPSLYEGLPVVAAEAQAAGIACLFSDKVTREADICGGAKFLPLDTEIWAQAMAGGLPPKADNAAKLAAAHYDIRTEAARLTDFYAAALAEALR